jgi:hypothetical protein
MDRARNFDIRVNSTSGSKSTVEKSTVVKEQRLDGS